MFLKRLTLGLSLLLVLGALPAPAIAQSPNVYTSVVVTNITSGAPVVGGTFTTDVHLSITNNATPPVGIMGADLWIRFDPAILAVDDADDNPANGTQVTIRSDFFGGSVIVAANEVATCPSGGTCVHLGLSHTGTPITSRSGAVATITWAALAQGDAALAVALPETVLADQNGADVVVNSVTAPAITVVLPGTVQGRVLRQGTRTDNANTEVTAYSSSGGVVATTTTLADGSFTLSVPRGGTYLVQATYNGYLKAQRSSVYVVGATVNIGDVTLRGGDVNGDNNINILDIVTIISRYGTSGWPATDPADVNDDGTINIYDLTITSGNFGRYGPVAW